MDLARGILRGAFTKQDGNLEPIDKDTLNTFCHNLDQVIQQQLPESSSESTESLVWILANVAPSSTRTAAFGKYLVKLVEAQSRRGSTSHVTYSETGDPRRQRNSQSNGTAEKSWYSLADAKAEAGAAGTAVTALVFLAHVFDAICIRIAKDRRLDGFVSGIKVPTLQLLQHASLEEGKQALDIYHVVHRLLSCFKEDATFDEFETMELREIVRGNYDAWLSWLKATDLPAHRRLVRKNNVLTSLHDLPRYHGNMEEPWYQQPAGTILDLIQGQNTINTERIRPISMTGMTIDPELADIVSEHVKEGDRIYALTKISPYLDHSDVRLNSLGFRVQKDAMNGRKRVMETYYGHQTGHFERLKCRKTTSRSQPQPDLLAQQQRQVKQMPMPISVAPRTAVPEPMRPQGTPPPPQAAFSSLHDRPPPPPPSSGGPAGSPPFPFQIPPRPSDWNGPWPPPPPLAAMGNPSAPPPPPPAYPLPNGSYGYNGVAGRGMPGNYGRGHSGGRGSYQDGHSRGRGGQGRGRGRW
ncbi:hypothetical protein KVT40_004082 [Elsinoe batatas]|uniref:Uncharacterized protein n=1 Tax=Elsinoe batatas TaxID=2601811 RepID=A0A8K0L4B1_9PEZI|nr:hypothetical protein KVT40_004082 [Elsinoe batatas]